MLNQWMFLVFTLYAWGDNSSTASHRMQILGISVSVQTVKQIFKDVRALLYSEFKLMRDNTRLGGPNSYVEIDESMFGHD